MKSNTTPAETSLSPQPVQKFVDYLLRRSDQPTESIENVPSMSETLRLLASERRRYILEELAAETHRPLSRATLIDRVACTEYDCTPDDLSADQRNRVYVALVQSHIPAYADADVVTYDEETNTIDIGPAFPHVHRVYEAICEASSR